MELWINRVWINRARPVVPFARIEKDSANALYIITKRSAVIHFNALLVIPINFLLSQGLQCIVVFVNGTLTSYRQSHVFRKRQNQDFFRECEWVSTVSVRQLAGGVKSSFLNITFKVLGNELNICAYMKTAIIFLV